MIAGVGPPSGTSRRSRVRAAIAIGIAVLALVASVASLATWAATPLDLVTFVTLPLAFGGVGAFLTIRVPGNPIGPMLLAATLGFATLIACGAFVSATLVPPTTDPVVILAALLTNLVFIPSLVLILVGVPLLFPNGQFLSRRWRWVAIAATVTVVVAELRTLFGTPELATGPGLPNPFYIEAAAPVFAITEQLETLVAVPLFVLSIWSLVLRYRRSDEIGRHQIRWLAATAAVAVTGFAASFFAPQELRPLFEGVGILALNAIPVAIGIAIARYRLFEIDRIISRSISYALISVVLLAAYVALVLFLQGPLGGLFGGDAVAVAASTLVVAALFQPLRRRVQRVVDRRFDRARFDAEAMATAFADRLRDEVDLGTVVADLESTVGSALRPNVAGLWLRDPTR